MQSVQQPAATSVGYPPLYSRSNQKVLANGHRQQQPHRQTILQPQFRHQQSLERPATAAIQMQYQQMQSSQQLTQQRAHAVPVVAATTAHAAAAAATAHAAAAATTTHAAAATTTHAAAAATTAHKHTAAAAFTTAYAFAPAAAGAV